MVGADRRARASRKAAAGTDDNAVSRTGPWPFDSLTAECDPHSTCWARKSLGLKQADFWGRIEVTQSGGSRYENGRPMPRVVRKLLGIVYLNEKV